MILWPFALRTTVDFWKARAEQKAMENRELRGRNAALEVEFYKVRKLLDDTSAQDERAEGVK